MSKNLFENFDKVPAKEWKQKIQFDLKGADYNEALIYKTLEGIDIKPFYHQEDLSNSNPSVSHPTSWKNSIRIEASNAKDGNTLALQAIEKGAESIFFIVADETVTPDVLLNEIPDSIPIYIDTQFLSVSYIKTLDTIASETNKVIHVFTDIIGNLGKTGNWFINLEKDHAILEEISKNCLHLQSIISVDTSIFQNAGATMVQQLAYALAQANEYLNHFDTQNNNPFQKKQLVFKVATGGNYFFEIAKLRALRLLWQVLAKTYGIQEECSIMAFPSYRNKTILDYNVNMLRTTTECMSAILGGANTIHNLPYDYIYNFENEFGTRISLNQLLILKNESYLDMVNNPASGSYYIENLTDQLAEKSLSLFKNIETGGGFLTQLKSGIIQKKIKESAEKEQKLFDDSEIILTGSNKYQNQDEIIPTFQKEVFPTKKSRKTLLEPIITSRLSEKLEKKNC